MQVKLELTEILNLDYMYHLDWLVKASGQNKFDNLKKQNLALPFFSAIQYK